MQFDFRLPPGPDTVAHAQLAESLGYNRVWCPEIPAFGHDIWITLARVAEHAQQIGLGAAVLVPSFRHPVAQASAIATIEHLAPGRFVAGFGTGFTGRGGLGQPPLTLAAMREHITQLRALLNGEAVEIDGALARMLPFTAATRWTTSSCSAALSGVVAIICLHRRYVVTFRQQRGALWNGDCRLLALGR